MKPDQIERKSAALPSTDAVQGLEQQLSSLLDGELEADQCAAVVEQLRHDEASRLRWERFACAGDALRSAEVAAWHSNDFVARVSAALESEPTVLAPTALPARSAVRRWLLPGAGAAAAAAVLLAIGLPGRDSAPPQWMAEQGQRGAATPVAAPPAAVRIDRSPVLERYLAAHRELAEPALMPNSTPYVRTSATMALPESR